jgi:transposase
MPKPYSYDLREKVIRAIEFDGLKKSEASLLFNISRNTIDLWLKRRAETIVGLKSKNFYVLKRLEPTRI